jgi:hypothetical protein
MGVRIRRSMVLGLVLASVASACSRNEAALRIVRLLPGDAHAVAEVNVARVRQTIGLERMVELRDRHHFIGAETIAEFGKAFGCDPYELFDRLTVAVTGGDAFVWIMESGRTIDEGALARRMPQAAQEPNGGAPVAYRGHELHALGEELVFTMLDGKTLAIGSAAKVTGVIDRAAGKGSSSSLMHNRVMMSLYRRVTPDVAGLWAIGQTDDDLRLGIAAMRAVPTFTAHLEVVPSDALLRVVLDTATAGDALELEDRVKRAGWKGTAGVSGAAVTLESEIFGSGLLQSDFLDAFLPELSPPADADADADAGDGEKVRTRGRSSPRATASVAAMPTRRRTRSTTFASSTARPTSAERIRTR